MKKILVISVHPDDEVLGCGGTLLKHNEKGDNLSWLIVTGMKEEKGFTQSQIVSRQKEIDLVAAKIKFDEVIALNYASMELSGSSLISLVPDISSVFTRLKPEIIYTINRSDAHSDHRVVFDAVMACTKSFRYPFINQVLMYECISETEFAPALAENAFIPNYFVNISDYIDRKIELMEIYMTEYQKHPFPRSEKNIRALATFRGAQCGVDSAEAFMILKQIWK
jgi:N-acetylglucosamine malate deacetylase 1